MRKIAWPRFLWIHDNFLFCYYLVSLKKGCNSITLCIAMQMFDIQIKSKHLCKSYVIQYTENNFIYCRKGSIFQFRIIAKDQCASLYNDQTIMFSECMNELYPSISLVGAKFHESFVNDKRVKPSQGRQGMNRVWDHNKAKNKL